MAALETRPYETWGDLAKGLPSHLRALYEACALCPRACGVDRAQRPGVCGAGVGLRLGRAALHWWEEPCLVGEQGSGAVFFSWCPMHCVYCQNMGLANGDGIDVADGQLEQVFLRLQNEEHAANINLVTPTHYVPHIAWTLAKMRQEGTLRIPVVYNTSGYESVETLRLLDGLVDIYLVDYKYATAVTARELSRCADYPQVAVAAIREMLRQVGPWKEDAQGMLQRGVIVRHLVLPNRVLESCQALDLLKLTLGTGLSRLRLSIMGQFTPLGAAGDLSRHRLDARVAPEEYELVLDHADELGIEDYFWQEGGAAEESFIPAFDGTGVL